jgi:hypothetical protein
LLYFSIKLKRILPCGKRLLYFSNTLKRLLPCGKEGFINY